MVISSKSKIPEMVYAGRLPEKEFERITRGAYHFKESCDAWGWVIDVFYPNDLGAELRSRESRGRRIARVGGDSHSERRCSRIRHRSGFCVAEALWKKTDGFSCGRSRGDKGTRTGGGGRHM